MGHNREPTDMLDCNLGAQVAIQVLIDSFMKVQRRTTVKWCVLRMCAGTFLYNAKKQARERRMHTESVYIILQISVQIITCHHGEMCERTSWPEWPPQTISVRI